MKKNVYYLERLKNILQPRPDVPLPLNLHKANPDGADCDLTTIF